MACKDETPPAVLEFLCEGNIDLVTEHAWTIAWTLLQKFTVKYQESEEDTDEFYQARMSKLLFLMKLNIFPVEVPNSDAKTDILWMAINDDCTVGTLESIVSSDHYVSCAQDLRDDNEMTSSAIYEISQSDILRPVLTPLLRDVFCKPRYGEWIQAEFQLFWQVIRHEWEHNIERLTFDGLPSDAISWINLFALEPAVEASMCEAIKSFCPRFYIEHSGVFVLKGILLYVHQPPSKLPDFVSCGPSLGSLQIDFRGYTPQDWTNTVVQVLNLNQLKRFDLKTGCSDINEDLTIDVDQVLEPLKRNNTLKEMSLWPRCFEFSDCHLQKLVSIVEEGTNTTLKMLYCHSSNFSGMIWGFGDVSTTFQSRLLKHGTPDHQKLNYYLMMNHWERKKAKDPLTNKEEFVKLLCQVTETDIKYSHLMLHNILHGLLKENPTVWST
jgi:hypothetical protein